MRLPERPSLQELGYFAGLIYQQNDNPATLSNVDDAKFVRKLDYHGIAILALQSGQLPTNVTKRLTSRKAMMVANEVLKRKALIELFDAFQAADLNRSILFKGSTLAYTIYNQPWHRPRSDSDCLIDQTDYTRFAKVFNALGYQKLFAIEGKHISYQCTFSKPLAGQSVMNIDLHWRINNRQTLARAYSVDELIETGTTLDELSSNIKIPSAANSMIIASLHRLGHHHNEERLIWLYDIHLLSQSFNQSDWLCLCEIAEQKQLAAITLDALQYCQRLFATAPPDNVLATLHGLAQKTEPSQLFLSRDLSEWQYFLHDIKQLEGTCNKWQLIIENFFPNSDYIKQQMGTQTVLTGYLKRITRGIRRITE